MSDRTDIQKRTVNTRPRPDTPRPTGRMTKEVEILRNALEELLRREIADEFIEKALKEADKVRDDTE